MSAPPDPTAGPRAGGAPLLATVRAGLAALRGNPLRTALSALGVIIGVGAMVSVLALSDGVEEALRERLAADGRLLTLRVRPRTGELVDGQFLPRAEWPRFGTADARALADRLGPDATVDLIAAAPGLVSARADARRDSARGSAPADARGRGVLLRGAMAAPPAWTRRGLLAGRFVTPRDAADSARVLVASHALAVRLLADGGTRADTSGAREPGAASLVGRDVWLRGAPWRVVGVLAPDENDEAARAGGEAARRLRLGALVPITALPAAALVLPVPTAGPLSVPELTVVATRVEALAAVRGTVTTWLAERYGAAPRDGEGWKGQVELASYEKEGAEVGRAMLIFRLLMGAITGISLVVGGVGIMNVLLASVSERTREIGITRAVGARARDVLRQYLAESVAIAGVGALLGTVLGVGVAHLVAAVMRRQAEIPVHAGFSAATLAVAVLAPMVVGLAFGLYPAIRAARLSPIDAIRHE